MRVQSATFAVLSGTAVSGGDLGVDVADCGRLLELLGLLPDPRHRRGVRHAVAALLAIAAAAVLAGSRSVLAIGEWAAEAPQQVLAALGARRHRTSGRFIAPHVDTFRRLLRVIDAAAIGPARSGGADRCRVGPTRTAPGPSRRARRPADRVR